MKGDAIKLLRTFRQRDWCLGPVEEMTERVNSQRGDHRKHHALQAGEGVDRSQRPEHAQGAQGGRVAQGRLRDQLDGRQHDNERIQNVPEIREEI